VASLLDRRNYGWLVSACTGFLLFSTAGELLLRQKIGFPYNLQELWLLVLLPFLRPKSVVNDVIRILFSPSFLFVICLVWMLLAIPVFKGYPLYDVLRSARPIFYIVATASYFSRHPNSLSINSLYWLCVGAMIGDTYATAAVLDSTTTLTWGQDEFVHGMNITAIFVAVSCAILSRRSVSILLAYSIATAVIVLSSFRINLIALLSATMFSTSLLLLKIKGGHARIMVSVKAGIAFSVIALIFYSVFSELQFIWYRFYERSSMLLRGNASYSEDDIRLKAAIDYIRSLDAASCLPNGFVTVAKDLISFHYDLPIAYFIDTFGVVISLIMLFLFVRVLYVSFAGLFYSEWMNSCTVARLYILFFLPLLLLLNGRVFYAMSESMLFGIILGIASSTLEKPLLYSIPLYEGVRATSRPGFY
jgi:hypothetical protein